MKSQTCRLVLGICTSAAFIVVLSSRIGWGADGDAKKAPESKTLTGKNPNGDVLVFTDGRIWKNVTVEQLRAKGESEKRIFIVKVKDVPPGEENGEYTYFKSIALRTDQLEMPQAEDVRDFKELTRTGKMKRRPEKPLPAIGELFGDQFLLVWEDEFDPPKVSIKYSKQMTRRTRDGTESIFKSHERVTITHVVISGSDIHCLVRSNTLEDDTLLDGWYSGIDEILFSRMPDKRALRRPL